VGNLDVDVTTRRSWLQFGIRDVESRVELTFQNWSTWLSRNFREFFGRQISKTELSKFQIILSLNFACRQIFHTTMVYSGFWC